MKISTLPLYLLFLLLAACSKNEDKHTYFIYNDRFGISAEKTNARATTDGINKAIEQAKNEGYSTVKLAKGDYLIDCADDGSLYPTNGIFVPTNITLDLGDAKLYVAPNSAKHYALLQVDHVENATIIGGHLIGDRYEHTQGHFQGYGIQVIASRNVIIKDVKIEGMTGEGIIFTAYTYMHFHGRFPSKNIRITDCDIFDCGRHGIRAIQTKGIEISNNRFHDILGGGNSQYAIDINPDPAWQSIVENVKIHSNIFKNCTAALRLYGGSNIEVSENTFEDMGIFAINCKQVRIIKNTLTERGSIYLSATSEDICVPTEGAYKNVFLKLTDLSTKTASFTCP